MKAQQPGDLAEQIEERSRMSKPPKSRQLNALALDRLAYLLTKTGHQLQPSDFGYVDHLNKLADRVTNADDEDEQSILNLPVPCGNIVLRKPSIGKLCWFNECAVPWFADEPSLCDLAFAYLLSLPNQQGVIDDLVDAESSAKLIGKWARKLTCTEAEFEKAIGRVYPSVADGGGDDESDAKYGPTLALLSREYGGTPSGWCWTESVSMIQAMLADYVAKMQAEHAAQKRATGGGKGFHKGGSAKPVKPAVTPTVHNLKALRLYVAELEAEWSRDDG